MSDEIRELVEFMREVEIAPLPWSLLIEDEPSRDGEDNTRRFLQHDGQVTYEMVGEIWYGDTEAQYVLLAVNAVPALLAERDALRDALGEAVADWNTLGSQPPDRAWCRWCREQTHDWRNHAELCPLRVYWARAEGGGA